MNQDLNNLQTDIAIIGGGIAGLMLQQRLNNLGYSTLLLEQKELGSGQTCKAQGILHGGIKYALLGQITEASAAISEQPKIWKNYFNKAANFDSTNKQNHIDLSHTKILSDHHDLWNNGDLQNKLKQIIMQKALSSHGKTLEQSDLGYPSIFKHKKFKGNIYRIDETVVDMFSLLEELAKPLQNKIIKIDQHSLNIHLDANNAITSISFEQSSKPYNIEAVQYIFTCGENNQAILDLIPDLPKMQSRPLHMVLAKFPEPNILFGHYIGKSMLPQLTVTTHYTQDGEYVWYIGGAIAETGIYLDRQQQIVQAKVEISNIFPWLDTEHWQWSSFLINRAEPIQHNNKRPDHACFSSCNNAIVAWPIKMTLAPMLADKIIDHFKTNNIISHYKQIDINNCNLKTAVIAKPVWEELFAHTTV